MCFIEIDHIYLGGKMDSTQPQSFNYKFLKDLWPKHCEEVCQNDRIDLLWVVELIFFSSLHFFCIL